MRVKQFLSLVGILSLFLLLSCKKDEVKPKPEVSFTASKTTVVVNEQISFTNASLNAVSYAWSFGDGTTSTLEDPTKSYTTPGTFTVTLVATGDGGTGTSNVSITVVAATVAGFTPSKTSAVIGETITFTSTSQNASTYSWAFGDGTTSTLESPTKEYTETGVFTVTLSVTGTGGTNEISHDVTITTATAIYFIDSSDEIIASMTMAGIVTTIKDVAGMSGVGIAYDDVHNKIFFSDFYDADTPDGKIWTMNPDGTGAVAIASGILDPYGIALDVTGGKIYWVDDNGNVSRANLDGTSPEIGFVNIDGGGLRAIALDKDNSKMYFFDAANDVLYVANLDGTGVAPLIEGIYGYAILVDTVNDKIYFDSEYVPALMRANLDGTGVVEIYKNPDAAENDSRIYGLAIDYDLNKLFWSCRDDGNIYQANLDGTERVILKTGLSSPRGIFLKK